MSKANRQKGAARVKQRFVCWNHEHPFKGPIRFKYEEARKDWERHNIEAHFSSLEPGDWVHEDELGKFVGGQEIVIG